MRQFNVFSEKIVTHPGETFEWIVNQAELPSGSTSVTVEPTGSTWPLSAPSYVVVPGTPLEATVNGQARTQAGFQCNPPAPDVSAQTVIVASNTPFDVCDEVNVMPGDYFFWKNDSSEPATVKPSTGNTAFWPLPDQSYTVAANGVLHLQVPTDADDGSYTLLVETESGGDRCPQLGQPKIVVESGTQ